MKYKLSVLILLTCLTIFLFSCRDIRDNSKEEKQNHSQMIRAEQIKIADLKSVLIRLRDRQLEFDFFGIHSNGIDCIYFMPDSNLFNIDFEAMIEEQLPWIDKLKKFAELNGFKTQMTTYGNKPHYKTSNPAPVLHIETKSSLDQIAIIGYNIMAQVFGHDEKTIYEVVP
jgi:hypothetical protein